MAMFGARDLALFLPDQAGDVQSLRHTNLEEDKFEPLKPKIDQSKKVIRYFPGKAPIWIGDETEGAAGADVIQGRSKPASATTASAPVPSAPVVDRRLARLAAATNSSSDAPSSGRRRIYQAEVIVSDIAEEDNDDAGGNLRGDVEVQGGDDEDQEEDEEDIAARRLRVRQKLAAAAAASSSPSKESELAADAQAATTGKTAKIGGKINLTQFAEARVVAPPKVVQLESESEYETDSDDEEEEDTTRIFLKPVFVPKHKRETIKDESVLEAEELARAAAEELRLEQRKAQTRELLADSLRRKEEERSMLTDNTDNDSDAGLPDDTDDLENEEEFDNWKLREITRLKRDAEVREKAAIEKADLERRRGLTEEERLKEDQASGRFDEKEKTKWRFMQKYYHKGAFYMDEESLAKDDIRKREFNEPTLEDKFNRESLPSVLQVKKFGFRGRTKYTHLLDQDTTRGATKPLQVDEHLQATYLSKRAGVHGDVSTAGRVVKKQKL